MSQNTFPAHRHDFPAHHKGLPVDRNGFPVRRNKVPVRRNGFQRHRNPFPVRRNKVLVRRKGFPVPSHGLLPAAHAGPLAPKTGLASTFSFLLTQSINPMNRIKKLLLDYSYLRVSEISAFAHAVIGSIMVSSYIAGGKALVAGLEIAVKALDDFTEAHPQLTKPLTAQLTVLRKAVLAELFKIATQLNLDFAGNEAALLSSGLVLAADPQALQPPVAPALCEIVFGTQSGSMGIHIKRAPGTMNVKWYYTTDPALPLEQWKYCLLNADELSITGLKAGERLHAKAACINSASTLENLVFAEAKPRYVE